MGTVNVTLHNGDPQSEYDTYTITDNNLNGRVIGPIALKGGNDYPFVLEQDDAGWGDCTIKCSNSNVPYAFHIVHEGQILTVP